MMKRRILLKTLAVGTLLVPVGHLVTRRTVQTAAQTDPVSITLHDPEPHFPVAQTVAQQPAVQKVAQWDRISQFDNTFSNDVFLTRNKLNLLKLCLSRMIRLQNHVGHGHFNILGFDSMLRYAQQFPDIGTFTKNELEFIEEIFHHDAQHYGFMGKKVMQKLTDKISIVDITKIAGSGHYLYYGEALDMYQRLKKDIGPTLVLTSGIRGMAKQLYLFLSKAKATGGNLSRASRSLAPPGHSYHGIGDFDVGQANLGTDNFTARFSESMAYKQLRELEYIDIRYTSNNHLGVRFEPWHIKVVT